MIAKWFCVVVLQLLAMTFPCCAHDVVQPEKVESDETPDSSGEELLSTAIVNGDLVKLKRLFSVLDPETISNFHCQPWECSNIDVIVFLRDNGKFSPSDLQLAALRGDADEVRAVIKRFREQPKDLNSVNLRTPLEFGSYSFIDSHTPLRLAIRRGHAAVVRVLLAEGANVNQRIIEARRHRFSNEYPLSEAVQLENTEIVQMLVDAGAILEDSPVRYHTKDRKLNLVEFYQANSDAPKALVKKKLKEMLDAGLIGEERDLDANVVCPLWLAIQAGRAKTVSILLNAGANPNVLIGGERLHPGDTPNMYTTGDRRPLHVAAVKGNSDIARLLIEKGADVNALTSDGRTPLFFAVAQTHGDVADILRAAGAK